jgi:hypothetical protein
MPVLVRALRLKFILRLFEVYEQGTFRRWFGLATVSPSSHLRDGTVTAYTYSINGRRLFGNRMSGGVNSRNQSG